MSRSRWILVCAIALAIGWSASVSAQVVRNPTRAVIQGTWTQAEYDAITEFRLLYYSIPATADGLSCVESAPLPGDPVQVVIMAKPTVYTSGEADAPLPARPLGCYRARVVAVGNGLVSDISPGMSNPFALPPTAASGVVIR